MAIRTVVTRGYGNGTFNGIIEEVVLRGYDTNPVVADVEQLQTPLRWPFNGVIRTGRLLGRSLGCYLVLWTG